MTINVNEKSYVSKLWFVHWEGGDWFGALHKTTIESDEWIFQYRFRYYKDNKAFDSDDKKSWWRATSRGVEEDVLVKQTDEVAKNLAQISEGRYDEIVVKGNSEIMSAKMAFKNWAFMQIRPNDTNKAS